MKLRGITIIIAFFVIIQSAAAYKYEKSKTIEKTFSCKEGVELNISNTMRGNTTINTWEKDEIKIKATTLIRMRKKDILDDILDNHEIIFSQDANSVTSSTHIINKWKWKRKRNERWDDPEDYISSVTYEIFVPKYAHINTKNRHGHCKIDGYFDNIKAEMHYGDIILNNENLDAGETIILGHGGHITLNCYSKVIDIKNKYGDIEFRGKSENITIESSYGDVYVANESVPGNVFITNRYGKTKYIGGFTAMTLKNHYGSISVENTGDSGESAIITTRYANIKYLGYAKTFNLRNHYGDIVIDNNTSSKIENITVSNRYGNVNLNNVENINILTCTGDEYKVRNANSITIDNANYANFEIDGLKDNFIIKSQMKYGDINIQRIDPNFKNIQIPNYYSSISLSFVQLNNYSIDISGKIDTYTDEITHKTYVERKSGELKIDEALKSPSLNIIETDSMFKVTQAGTAGKIVIESEKSDIRLEKEQ